MQFAIFGRMKRYVIFLGLLLGFACSHGQDRPKVSSGTYETMLNGLLTRDVPEVSVKELDTTAQNVLLLDARERGEYEVSHLDEARWVGYDDFNLERVADIPKDSAIVVYCSVGYRSERVTEQLQEAGYTNVRNLYGGIFEWSNEDLEVVDPEGDPTNKVHAYDRVWGVWLSKGKKVYKP